MPVDRQQDGCAAQRDNVHGQGQAVPAAVLEACRGASGCFLQAGGARSQSSSRTDRNSRKSRVARRSIPGTLSKSPTRTCRARQRHSDSQTQRVKKRATSDVKQRPLQRLVDDLRQQLSATEYRHLAQLLTAELRKQAPSLLPPVRVRPTATRRRAPLVLLNDCAHSHRSLR